MDKFLRIAVMLTALDRMSGVVDSSVTRSIRRMQDLENATQKAQKLLGAGLAEIASGAGIALAMKPALDAFMELENAASNMKSSMLEAGNILPVDDFEKLGVLAEKLGNYLPGTTADFYAMFTRMKQLGVETDTILNGAGESAAYLAVVLNKPYEQVAEVVSKLKNATGTADEDLKSFIDTVARTANVGVNLEEMQYAFARSSPALKTLNIQGAEASKTMASLFAVMIKGGLSGETTGTNMMALLNQLMDSDKIGKMNAELAKLGQAPLSFSDSKTGQFLGIENMIAQFDQIGTLNPQQISDVVAAAFGPGMDAGIVKIMASAGIKGFNEMNAAMNKQGMLGDKVGIQLDTLSAKWESVEGSWSNTMAKMFAPMGEALKPIVVLMADAAEQIGIFAGNYPDVFKIAGIIASVAAGFLMVSGAIKIARAAMLLFNIMVSANPIGLIIAAVVAAALLIYTYWEPISKFFGEIWETIKNRFISAWGSIKAFFMDHWNTIKTAFSDAWEFIKNAFFSFTPLGIIIKNWGAIKDFFSNLFTGIFEFITGLHLKFLEAGKNIVKSIAEGIMGGIKWVTDAIGKVTTAAREYLPFSPAKQGAFRDLHKVKIVETIAGSMSAAPLTRAMGGVTSAGISAVRTGGNSGGGGFNYSPTITITGNADVDSFKKALNAHKDEIIRIFENQQARKARLAY